MAVIGTPIPCPELNIVPEPEGAVGISKDMQQTFALLTGFWRNKRILLKATPSGGLCVCSPQIKDVFHITADTDSYAYQGENVPCSEVLVMAHPDNTSEVWVKPNNTATVDNAWPLSAGDVIGFTISNLNMLNLLIVTNGEKVIITYTE